jgi:hypothetical protein
MAAASRRLLRVIVGIAIAAIADAMMASRRSIWTGDRSRGLHGSVLDDPDVVTAFE